MAQFSVRQPQLAMLALRMIGGCSLALGFGRVQATWPPHSDRQNFFTMSHRGREQVVQTQSRMRQILLQQKRS